MAGIPTCMFGADQGKLFFFLFDMGEDMIENVLQRIWMLFFLYKKKWFSIFNEPPAPSNDAADILPLFALFVTLLRGP